MGKKKKNDSYYFDSFLAAADYARKAAHLLDEVMHEFDPEALDARVDEMHEIEIAADHVDHEVTESLLTAFITPIEREDIDELSDAIDGLVDHIEGVMHRLYFNNIQEMRPDACELSGLLVRACDQLYELIKEFPQFKHPKRLREMIRSVNDIESEADRAYIKAMRTLHTTETDPMLVMAWRDVYSFLEYSADSAEDVANVVDAIVIKNS